MINLVPLSQNDGELVYKLLQKIGKEENQFHNEAFGLTYYQFKKWLIQQVEWSKGENLPEGYVRQWIYWLYDEDTPIGFGKLRERLTDRSREIGGNIGYAIASDQRGKGYGTILFKLLLKKANDLGIKEVLSTVEKNNEASKVIQEKCGGVLVHENEKRLYYSFNDALKKCEG